MAPNPRSRMSLFPQQSLSNSSAAAQKSRQLIHLNAKLSQLQASLADLESLVRVTAVQADHVRVLGGICGGMLMASQKVLVEGAGRDDESHEQHHN